MAVLGGLTTLAIIFSIVVSVRKDTLVGKREADEAAATSRTIQGQSEQVAGLKRQLSEAEENLAELTSQRTLTKEQKERIAGCAKEVASAGIDHHSNERLRNAGICRGNCEGYWRRKLGGPANTLQIYYARRARTQNNGS